MPNKHVFIGTSQVSRRHFLKSSSLLVGASVLGAPAFLRGQNLNGKINVACIGVGGKGDSDSNDAGEFGNIVAICDVDADNLNHKAQQFPNAKKYTDYRKLLEDISGGPVLGFRASGFSVTEQTPWFFEKLVEAPEYTREGVPAVELYELQNMHLSGLADLQAAGAVAEAFGDGRGEPTADVLPRPVVTLHHHPDHPPPGEVLQILEGVLGHGVPEVVGPFSEHRVHAEQQRPFWDRR